MPKKLAITIAGAVSLGSYESGVLYEVIHAIGQHNSDPATTAEDRIEIDVLTGASAGGMTATIAAQKLLFEAGSLDDPYANSFYRPWVADVTLDGLLALQTGEDSTHSILSSNLVEDISRKHLTQRYQSHLTPPQSKHAAAADKIRFGLALSNLNGVDYSRNVLPSGAFAYTRYQDELTTEIDSGNPNHDTLDLWEPLRNAAVACGAFPFAFRTKDLVRQQSEYTRRFVVPFPSLVETFTYTDGGVFQNEPLGMAKNLVDLIDPDHSEAEKRFYLFVAPGARGGTSNTEFREKVADFGATGKQLVAAVFQQSRFHDWITAEDLNEKVRLFDKRALALQQAFLAFLAKPAGGAAIDPGPLAPAAKLLLPPLFGGDATAQAAAWQRLKGQFQKEFDQLVAANGGDASVAETWIDSILAFETAADLGERDEMRIYGIVAREEELASSKFEAFLGFFDQAYRDHDYDVGRNRARDILEAINKTADPLGPIRYNPPPDRSDIHAIDHDLDGLEMTDVPYELRKQFKDRLTSRAHDFMEEIGIPTAIVREAIDLAFISPHLNKLLAL